MYTKVHDDAQIPCRFVDEQLPFKPTETTLASSLHMSTTSVPFGFHYSSQYIPGFLNLGVAKVFPGESLIYL